AQTRVGSPLPAARGRTTELGALSAADAVDLLLDLAPSAAGKVADDLLFPAMLADAPPPYPRLLALAGNEKAPVRVREKAVFWAAEAGAPASALQRVYEGTTSEGVREQVIFAYSRIHDPAGVKTLLRIARSDDPLELRKKAVFWLGQAAGREITKELSDFAADEDESLKVKEAAVFALSQRPRDEAVPALIRVAKTNPDPRVRKRALFWLGQTNDPRAVALFEEILK
ncbi:MAG TPA: HEAT repeat domain-containing protein, partial [Longimicrobiaceae bacterium]|nr:HEAT repeat domain-containing protein [Longimicrobiaceae bacterium]